MAAPLVVRALFTLRLLGSLNRKLLSELGKAYLNYAPKCRVLLIEVADSYWYQRRP